MQMTIIVRIGGEERDIEDADSQWVHQSIRLRERDGKTPCVEVRIHADSLNVRLASDCCAGGGGRGRRPNAREAEIISLWNQFSLGECGADLTKVWPFLVRLKHYLGLRAA